VYAQRRLVLGRGLLRNALLGAIALALAWGMVYYYLGVLLSIRNNTELGAWGIGGYQSDLYPRWLGARELLLHHRNPYSPEITEEIERGFYGRPIDPAMRPQVDPEAFAYPVYVTFLLAPLLPFPFEIVKPVFTAILLLLSLATLPLWVYALNLRMGRRGWFLAFLGMMSSYSAVEGLRLGQITVLVSFLIAGSLALLGSGWPMLAGVLLACAIVKPQLVYLLAAFLLVWSCSEWTSRARFTIGFAVAVAGLLIGSHLILPGWFEFWWKAVAEYVGWHRGSLLAALLGRPFSIIVSSALITLSGLVFWRNRFAPVGSARFNLALVTSLIVTSVILPNAGGGSFYNQMLLIPAVLWLFTGGRALARNYRPARIAWAGAVLGLTAEWLVAFAVSFAALILHYRFRIEASAFVGAPEFLMYAFPAELALFLLCVLSQSLRTHE